MKYGGGIFWKLFWGSAFSISAALFLAELLNERLGTLAASVVAALVALVAAFSLSHSFTARIQRMRAFAENLRNTPSAQVPLRESDDELGRLAASLNHIAARMKELASGLGEEAARREAILAGMLEGVLAVNERLEVIFCNDALARLLGADPLSVRLMPAWQLFRDRTLEHMLRQALISGETSKERLRLDELPGRTFEVQVSRLSAASRSGAIAILHDITDLERLERVRRDFVANVSHELRTPLTAIRGYAETLLEGALDDQQNNRRFLEIIQANANRLNSIASDLLILSELEHQPLAELEPVAIREVLESAVRVIEPEARVHEVRLLCEEPPDIEVMGEKVRLEQAFVNLFSNAVKFNRPAGEVRLRVARAGGFVHITVSDTGIGIPPEHLDRIFERFYRVDKARSRELGGTGLGLSIVKHVVERMGGSVSVESRVDQGSSFTVSLPLI